MARFAIASVINGNLYTALLLAWAHSVARQLHENPLVSASTHLVFVHCRADVPTLQTIADCIMGRYPTVRVRLIGGCVEHPSRGHNHFLDAMRRNTGHARFLNTWSIFHLWSLTDYEQVLYMDADTVQLRPIDGLIEQMREPMRTGHVGCVKVEMSEPCNSGVVLLRPSTSIFNAMQKALGRITQVNGFVLSDQDFFSEFFSSCLVQMNKTYNFANVKQGRPVPEEVHILHFQGHHAENKPVDYRAGGTLRYDRTKPHWPIFKVFESHFAPLYSCYSAAAARGGISPLFPPAPAKYKKGLVHHPAHNMNRLARKAVRGSNAGACTAPDNLALNL
mmetsp:Transcript_39219/g.96905  ORF Transcript_39219/g.96905 Transcript_39219/m.96905 type:complete len:334 (+) Transcript_39219:84-1085(+)